MNKFIAWILYSSANADRYSATIKNFVAFVPTILIFLGLIHIHIESNVLVAIVEQAAIVVSALGSAVLAFATLVSFVRKVSTTLAGTNDVLRRLN